MAIKWNTLFETGNEGINLQHQELINLVSETAPLLIGEKSIPVEHKERQLDRLFACASTHFKNEEELMRHHGVDTRHILQHEAEHAHFFEQLGPLCHALQGQQNIEQGLKMLGFLNHWVSVHLLVTDQRMDQQIALIEQGHPAHLAYEVDCSATPINVQRQALVTELMKMNSLFHERNTSPDPIGNLATIDHMTGLSNRRHFLNSLACTVADARAAKTVVVLMLVDVDDLTTINQTASHALADQLLIAIANRLREISRRLDLSARTGDDEFALVLTGGSEAGPVIDAAERVFQELSRPMLIAGEIINFSLSGGLAVTPGDAITVDGLLSAAEMAQASAKREGGACCRRFVAEMGHQLSFLRSDAVVALRNAIQNDQLMLHYQPQVSLHSGEIVGLEALVRWVHPTRGMVPPGMFIPLAEETGLIIPLGEWVIRKALDQCQQWQQQGLALVRVAVNLSAQHFRQAGLVALLETLLREHAIPPNLFELELTESVMMNDPSSAIHIVDQLQAIGVKLSIDDFGTGYSSLAYLSRLAINTLKIDQSFIHDITTNPVNASIAVATIAMAHKLGKSVIAEGVETEGQMTYLRRHDCDEMQGYFFSKPVPPEAIAEMLRNGASLCFGVEQANLPCLLLVDDEINILKALRRLLHREGYRVLSAESAAHALELLAENDVHVIVSDQRMQEMDGTEFLSRAKVLYPDTVRIMLSGYSELASVTDAVNRGAIYKYISKPWQDEELKLEIRRAFRHHRDGGHQFAE